MFYCRYEEQFSFFIIRMGMFQVHFIISNQQQYFCYNYLLYSLLMPKIIAPKRTNKSVTVEDYWAIRQNFSKKKEKPIVAYKQKEVEKRHRFVKLKEQIRAFNPLQYFITKDQSYASDQKTHSHTYLQTIYYRLPEEIMEVKKYMFGLASILKNLQKIYSIIWEHLTTDDAWRLVQALLKDTRQQSYDLWINKGLEKAVVDVTTQFKQSLFKQIFLTLSLFMEVCFTKISQSQTSVCAFLQKMSEHYFGNKNKYMRKFSIKLISYVMTNIEEQTFHKVILKILNEKEDNIIKPYLADILSQRLKYSDRCLTPNSLQQLISIINWLKQMKAGEELVTNFIYKVLTYLQQKRREEQNQSLFDLGYIVKAFVQLSQNKRILPVCLIKGIIMYLQEDVKQKYQKKRRLNEDILPTVSHFLWENLPQLEQDESVYHLLALSFSLPLQNMGKIKDYLSKCQDEQIILNFLCVGGQNPKKDTSMLLIASLKKTIQKYFNNPILENNTTRIEIMYKLFFMLKQNSIKLNLEKMFENQKIQPGQTLKELIKLYKIDLDTEKKELLYQYTLVFLRFLTVIEVSNQTASNLSILLDLALKNYYTVLRTYLESKPKQEEISIFKCEKYSQQIFLYSHESIPIVWQGFNILESFIAIQKSINKKIVNRNSADYKLWHKIVVNRVSNCHEIESVLQKNDCSYLFVLQSRHRAIRFITVQHLQKSKLFENCQPLIQMIYQIEQEDVDLENERNVKRMFLDMLRYIQQNQLSLEVNNALVSWCLGFAFTGFKLIEQSFTNFLAGLLQVQQNIDFTALIRFLQYYTFKNSRIYKHQTEKLYKQLQYQALDLPNNFTQLINKDFSGLELQTVEYIGVDRITLAISKSPKIKKRLSTNLMNIITQYFNEEFIRYKSTLIQNKSISTVYKNQNGQVNQLLLPPKTTYLKQILKLVPEDYLPPLQCLHYTSQYLKLQSVHKIKRQDWQLLWNRKTKMEQNRIKFQNMSLKEMEIYIHFLWGEMLRADANRLRILIEHIRDYMNHKVGYFMLIFLQELTLGVSGSDQLKNIYSGMDSRKLLTYMYILKTIIKTLKNYVRQNFTKIVQILTNIAEVVDNNKITSETMMQEQIIHQNGEEQEQQEQQQQEDEEQEQVQKEAKSGWNMMKKYKNHRKEIFRIFNQLVKILGDQIATQDIDQVLSVFKQQNKIKVLGQNSLNSTPGLLLFIKQIAQYKKFHALLLKYQINIQISQILTHGSNKQSNGSISVCINILNNMLGVHHQDQMIDQSYPLVHIQNSICQDILSNILIYLESANKIKWDIELSMFRIIAELMKKCSNVQRKWQKYLSHSLTQIVGLKTISDSNKSKLAILIQISMIYSNKSDNSEFLISLLSLIPQLKELDHRKLIVKALAEDIALGKQKAIGKQAVDIVMKLNSTVDGGLVQQINYSDFFDGISLYKDKVSHFSLNEHEFVIYNLLAYLSSPELSVRKSIFACLEIFLNSMNLENKQLIIKLLRIISEQLRKPYNSEDQIFWSIFACIGLFVRWIVHNDLQHSQNYSYFAKYIKGEDNQQSENMFDNLCAIAQKQKLNGLKSMKAMLSSEEINMSNKIGDKYPNILTNIFLPVLQHFIIPQTSNLNNKFGQIIGNLTSSLSHVSLQIYQLVMRKGGESLQKKQLKRMISKLKFDEMHLKKNILIIKIIGQIVESISLPKVTQAIHKIISEQGVEDFHRKMLQKAGKTSKIREDDNQSDEEQEIIKRKAFDGINNQIDDDELINIGYMNLDKKLVQAEDLEKGDTQESSTARFLRVNVLTPLKTMLMFENKSQKNSKEESDKSRMLLSVVVTKIILKFPVDVFMGQLQKILSKLAKLLKKRQVQIRQHARTCLAQISKLIGTDLLYMVFRELKFHLRDNFQHHVLNYTVYYLLEKYGNLENGAIDNCLPLLLPPIIDEIFGKASTQKQMVEQNLIPTINMQSRKRKSNDLLTIICKQISMDKIDYLVKYFEKFLLQYMNSQTNVNKYEQMLTNIIGGLNRNEKVMSVQNSSSFIAVLHSSIEKLKSQIKLYKFDDTGLKHESTVKQSHGVVKKAGKEVLQIQQQAGRNASIFKKKAKQIQQRRNHQVLTGCFMQLHLAILALLIKKKIINSEKHSQKFQSIITFIVECIDHRDNRIVHKCLKVIHNVIQWKKMPNISLIRKKTSRKIFTLIEKLTSADEDLLRQCFTLLNDLFEQVNITLQVLHILLTIIKLHITTIERTIAQQPFKLLKTVLIKISPDPTLLNDPSVYQLYQFVRVTLISTTLDHIRNICREICCLYIKQTKPSQEVRKKNKSPPTIDYNKQISLYLNNLDCKYSETQLALLDVIKTYVVWHSKQEIEQTGEVIIMSLGTAYANDTDNETKLTDVIRTVIQKIDNSKTMGLLDKCIAWANNQENELIKVCGFFILQNIMQTRSSSINHQRRQQISQLCSQILERQQEKVTIYKLDLKQKIHYGQTVKSNPEWKNIIEEEDVFLKKQKNFKNCTNILGHLLNLNKKLQNNQVSLLWKLVSAPSELIHSKVSNLILKISSISSVVGEKLLSLSIQEQDSLKNKIIQMVKNLMTDEKMEYGCQIAKKVLQQLKDVDNVNQVVQSIISALLNRVSKSILNLKKNQASMSMSYDFIQSIITVDQEICKRVLKNQKLLGEMFWNIGKVSRNQLIESTIKQKNQQLAQIIKNNIGEAEYYRRLASVEADRKQKRAQQKAELLKLAVVDQEAYGLAKAKKKHKK